MYYILCTIYLIYLTHHALHHMWPKAPEQSLASARNALLALREEHVRLREANIKLRERELSKRQGPWERRIV